MIRTLPQPLAGAVFLTKINRKVAVAGAGKMVGAKSEA